MLEQLNNLLVMLMALLGDERLKEAMNDPRIKLFSQALKCVGEKLTTNPELGCVDAIEAVHFKTFNRGISNSQSTIRLYNTLRIDKTFVQVYEPKAGDLILSPSGYGNGKLAHGHCGIVGLNGTVMSNNSLNGRWTQNYTIPSWEERYGQTGGFPILFFRKLSA